MLHGGLVMSKMLNFCDHLLRQSRTYQKLGVDDRALRILRQLSHLRDLPAEAAEEIQARLAELLLKRGQFARARRHLTAALAHHEDNARYHHLMAQAFADDNPCQTSRALEHYGRCVELRPDNPGYHA